MKILQISQSYTGGGAAKTAWNLHQYYQKLGLTSWVAVGNKQNYKQSNDPNVFLIDNDKFRSFWAQFWISVGSIFSPIPKLGKLVSLLGQPRRLIEILKGREDFDFPATWKILEKLPAKPDIIHCHNLHSNYFDLRALPWLSKQMPLILTLHDAWLLSGHCAHSFDCQLWKTGCLKCPNLKIYPSIFRDTAGFNWQRKREIYKRSHFYVATPCHWLMNKVKQSILTEGIIDTKVIPYGIDLETFYPGNQKEARTILNIPQDYKILLFVGKLTKSNIWKDYSTIEKSIKCLNERSTFKKIILICLGEKRKPKYLGRRVEVWFKGFEKDIKTVRYFYQAADVYVHPAKIDTFPNTVLEALACGKPVVASAVGGIPEQVKDGETGFLVPAGDWQTMAVRLQEILNNDSLRDTFGEKATQYAHQYFDLNRQVKDYLNWYKEILKDFSKH